MKIAIEQEYIWVKLSQISGQDKETKAFLGKSEYETDTSLDIEAWNKTTLQHLYELSPMILITRRDDLEYLGTGRAFRLAQEIFTSDELIPAKLIKSTRLKTKIKLELLAAELFGFPAFHRTRRRGPWALYLLWQKMQEEGVAPIVGDTTQDFSRATGYSVKTLVPSKIAEPRSTTEPVGKAANDHDYKEVANEVPSTK